MAFDPAKLKKLLSQRPRLLPVVIAVSAVAAPLYAAGVAARMQGTEAPVAAAAGTMAAGASTEAEPGRLAPGYTDLLAASAGGATPRPTDSAPAGLCEPALADLLATERQALADRQAELELRAQMLAAAEKKAGEQIARLTAASKELSALLDKRASMAKADLQRLVSIYENMKPKDAARLLNETDPEILVDLLDLMQERRSAPILAEMEADKVNALTRTLALRRVLPADRPTKGAAGAKPVPQTASLP